MPTRIGTVASPEPSGERSSAVCAGPDDAERGHTVPCQDVEALVTIIRPGGTISRPAMRWAARQAASLPQGLGATLLVVAACADDHGRGARVSAAAAGRATGRCWRQAQRDLGTLQRLGLIRRGDPRHATGRPGMGGPATYQLAMRRGGRRP